MDPFEPKKQESEGRLSLTAGTLACTAVAATAATTCLVLDALIGDHASPSSTWLLLAWLSLGFFALRVFDLCDMRHVALSLLPSGILSAFIRSNLYSFDTPSTLIAAVSVLLATGAFGMSAGRWASRLIGGATRPFAARLTTVSLAAGLLLCGPLYGYISYAVATFRAQKAGPAYARAAATELTRTRITPSLDVPIASGTNLIWCGTMQLAWSKLCALAKGDIQMENQDPVVAQLNRPGITASDLDASTYLAEAWPTNERSLQELKARVDKVFRGAVSPELIPVQPTSNGLILYAALFVNLPFEEAFNRLDHPFSFGGEPVAALGTEGHLGGPRRMQDVRSQVDILSFNNEDDFIVELKTKRTEHQLILAKVLPEKTFDSTVQTVLSRTSQPNLQKNYKDIIVPISDYDYLRTYPELLNRPLRVKNPMFDKAVLDLAEQKIRFKLDERGALLQSEAILLCKYACATSKETPRLIFDKPFLVLMKCRTSNRPYFAMWVDNAEVLVPYKSAKP